MKQILLVILLAVGCSIATRNIPTIPTVTPETKEVIPPDVTIPLMITYSLDKSLPEVYSSYIPRINRFYEILSTNDSFFTVKKFDYLSSSTSDIIHVYRAGVGHPISIVPFTPSVFTALKYRSTIATTYDEIIHLKYSNLLRPDCEVINTIVHETSHVLGFTHGANIGYQPNSFPYWIGDRAQEFCEKGLI